ncbi:B12-binding domain-containing radical SAM protein [Candidatus Magnetominusculus xianensis]|uniref:B12-binding domain-containing radical SAM protein n=1 Tax=Candidatus Magnetominusculus xianensis TaxID=1748249 RepID=A0ABR5SG02_9BACT|nr:radical SAM protein [Candidatus Magnetominusculus xianensis]KWT87091.1 B12-binding domain-containing radical SAM protein [Candidatus Magnetominusculus xianensis]MBF0404985.1 radical SAM protein [Nitrospirota bacterium]
MKVAFINPSLRPESKRRQLPVGLAYIMTAVKKVGYDFDLIDMDINNMSMSELASIMDNTTYDICAFGCIVTGFRFAREIADIAKRSNPNIVIIAGNSVASSIAEILLNNTKVDIGVMGEGDITIVELIQTIETKKPLSEIKGIAFKDNGKIFYSPPRPPVQNIDEIGFPDWDLFDLKKYEKYSAVNTNISSIDNMVSYPLNAARGCTHNCSFCYHVFKGQRYRKYSEDAVMDEIKRLHYGYSCNFISFWDELTFSTIKSVDNMVNKIMGLDFKIAWEASSRGNLFKNEHLELINRMREAGCDSISYSLENASPEILAAMNKKMKVEQFIEQSNVLWKGGVTPLTSVIFGYPQETPESIEATIKVCEECNIFPSVGFILPLPGTPIYDWAKNNGHITDEVKYLERIGDRQDFHINLTTMSDSELVDTVTEKLTALSLKLGLKLDSVFKTVTYQKPIINENKYSDI